MIGRTVSHYRILEKLGEGGMGVVYIAEDTVLGRRVAIKTLTSARGPVNQHFRMRFLREAQAISKLSHPHIASIYDYGEMESGEPYIVMELVDGKTLADLIKNETLTIPRAIEIIEQVAAALEEAHNRGIVHRDIKPSNIAINERGKVKVLDFGLAKHVASTNPAADNADGQTSDPTQTREGVIVGTPTYLSPEQALGVEVDARSDLFSLGSVLYECIAGRPAFSGKSDIDICAKVIRDDPPPPSQFNPAISAELDRLTMKALAKKPSERYQSAEAVIADLDTVHVPVSGVNQPVGGTTNTKRVALSARALATLSDIFKRPRLAVASVVAALALIGLLAFFGWGFNRATPHQPSPEVQRLYDLGIAALREGTYYKASKLLIQAVKEDDKFILGRAGLAEVWSELDYSDKAKDELLRLNALSKDQTLKPADDLYVQAISLKISGDSAGAIEKFEEIVRQASATEKAATYIDLARAHERDGNTSKAKKAYLSARQVDPRSTAAAIRLGVLYARQLDSENSNAATAAFDEAEVRYQTLNDVEGEATVLYERSVFLITRRKLSDARQVLLQALSKSEAIGDKYQQVRIRLQLSSVSCLEGDTDTALKEASEVIKFARENGLENLAANGLINLGNAFMARGNFAQAETSLNQSLELAQYYKARRSEGKALLVLASFYTQHQGNAIKVRDTVDRAVAINKQEGHRKYTLQALAILGHSNDQLADYPAALKAFGEQQALAEQLSDREQVALAHEGMGIALAHQQRYVESLAHFDEDAKIIRELELRPNELHAEINRANVLWRLGRYPEAEEALKFVFQRLGASPNPEMEAWAHLFQAQMALSRGQVKAAIVAGNKALKLSAQEFHEIALESKATLSTTYAEIGMIGKAKLFSAEALQAARQSSDNRLVAGALLAQSTVLIKAGEWEAARAAALESQLLFARMAQLDSEWQAWLNAAVASKQVSDKSSADNFARQASENLDELQKLFEQSAESYFARPDIQWKRQRLREDFLQA